MQPTPPTLSWPDFRDGFSQTIYGQEFTHEVTSQIFHCLQGCQGKTSLHRHQIFGHYVKKVCAERTEKKNVVTLIFDNVIGEGQRKTVYAAVKCSFHKDNVRLCFKSAVFTVATPDVPDAGFLTRRAWRVHRHLHAKFQSRPDLPFPLCKLPYWIRTNQQATSCVSMQKRYPFVLDDFFDQPFHIRCSFLALAAKSLYQLHNGYLAFHGDVTAGNFFVDEKEGTPLGYNVLLHDFDNTEMLEKPCDNWLPHEEFAHLSDQEKTVNEWLLQTPLTDILHFTRLIFGFLLKKDLSASFGHQVLLGTCAEWDRLLLPYHTACYSSNTTLGTVGPQEHKNRHALRALLNIFNLVWEGTKALQQNPETYRLASELPVTKVRSEEQARSIYSLIHAHVPNMAQHAEILEAIAALWE